MPVKRTVHRHKKTRGGQVSKRAQQLTSGGAKHPEKFGSRKHRHTIRKSKPSITVGLIYANWCGHCNALKPEWKKMKKGMRGMNCHYLEVEDADPNKDRKIADVNSRLKGEKLVANGYPTVFKVKGGNLEYYQGERTAQAMQQWFKGGSAPQQQQQQEMKAEPTLIQRVFGGQKGGCDCDKKF